ncbi:MAG: choice-of-anchor Q domain-containing protein, partial [Saprospiraceae bacterium]
GSTITFDPALSGDTITLNGTQLTIDKDLTITGNVPINISGNEQSRVFNLTNNATITMESLTIQDGNGNGNGNIGGAILVNSGVTLTLRNSTIRNSRGRSSGAIDNSGTLMVENCTFWGNRSTNFSGGAMVNRSVATIKSSTISGNTSNAQGGGLFNATGSTLTISHSTITDNQAQNGAGGITSHRNNSTETRLYGSIVAGNNGSGGDLEIDGTNNTFVSDGYNLIGTLGDNVVMVGTGDQINIAEPKIGALADNGGPTLTHILLSGSPAIDAADNGNCPATDQRGEARPIDGTCDIGAVEVFVSTVADLTIADLTVSEADGTADVVVTSSATAAQDITVEYTTTSGTATADNDFTIISGTATISAGETQTTISVPIIDDPTFEPAETFSVVLSKPTVASLADNSATVTINDNDLGPSLIVTSLNDGQDGSFNFGENTLREAFALATDGDIITFDAALSGDTITLNGSSFGISKEVSIVSTIPITISADSLNRIFSISGNGDLTIDGLTIRDGVRGSNTVGGVIQVNSGGRLTVRNCTVSNSTAGFSAIGIWGGGTAIFENSLITENSGRQGGAFWVRGNLTMTNCTISNNTASGGAAIYAGIGTPVINLTHCSLIGNFATGAGSGIRRGSATITIGSSIIANDISRRSNCNTSNFISLGNNIISDGTCFDGSVESDQFSTDPMVAQLADNGGPTLTHALLCGSPAIDAGGTSNCTATDQRGVMRPIDGDGDETATCDVGAFESPSKVIPTITFESSDADNAICPGEEVTFTASGGDNYEFFVNTTSMQQGTDATYKTSTLTDGAEVYVIVTNSDECDKTSSTITISVSDTEDPVPDVTNLPDLTAQCSIKIVEPTATDNCAGAITATTTNPTSYTEQGTYTITWKYNDGNGNSVMQTQKVIIDDTQKPMPVVANLPDVTGQCDATVTAAPKATDNCASGQITATTTDPLTYNQQGTHTITWTYNDGNGNTETQTQKVIVEDTQAPTALCQNISVQLNANGEASITAEQIDNGSS